MVRWECRCYCRNCFMRASSGSDDDRIRLALLLYTVKRRGWDAATSATACSRPYKSGFHLTTRWPAMLVAQTMRAICTGFVIPATRGRRRSTMVASGTHPYGLSTLRKGRLDRRNEQATRRRLSISALALTCEPSVGLLAQPFFLVLRCIDLATRIANLNATSSCVLAPFVHARGSVTNSGRCSCLRHDNAERTGKKRHRENRNCET
jgi:hypothetical protein